MSNESQKSYFPQLTGLRAITAYLVFLRHFNPFEKSNIFLHDFFDSVYITMTIFFVLSGFVITHRYIERVPSSVFTFKHYIIDRIARICPLYFGATLITFLWFIYRRIMPLQSSSFIILFVNITFTKTFFNDLKLTLISQGWTLTVEWCFYICAPLLIVLVKRSFKFIPIIAIGLMLVGMILVQTSQYFSFPCGFFSDNTFMFIYSFFGRCFDFLCGVGLAVFLHKQKERNNNTYSWYTYSGILSCFLTAFVVYILGPEERPISPWVLLIHNTLQPMAVGLFLYGLISEKSIFTRIFSSKLMVLLGVSSYAFYIIHLGIFSDFIKFKIAHGNFILHFILLNILSVGIYKYIEKPLYKKVKKYPKLSILSSIEAI